MSKYLETWIYSAYVRRYSKKCSLIFQRWIICTSLLRFFKKSVSAQNPTMVRRLLRIYRELYKSLFGISAHIRKKIHVSIKVLRVCANNPKMEDYYQKSPLGVSAHVRKNFYVFFKIWRICHRTKSNNNGAQNTSTYLKGNIQIIINLGVSAHVRKNFHVSIKDLRICANNLALEDFVIQNHF